MAATRRKEGFDQQHSPATFIETPTVSYARAVALLQRVVRESGAPDPGEPAAQRFVQAVSVRPGILIGRGDGLSFIRPDHQRFLAALHLAADLGASDDQATTADAALSTLRSWSNLETAQDDMVELFGILGESGALVERVGRRILGDGKDRSLDELSELAPIALALQENGRDVPPALRSAARALVDDAVERWAVERHKLPPWTRDLAPIAEHIELEQLDLSGCAAVQDLGPLRGLTRLERLEMRDCTAVTDVGPLADIDALKWADLRGCTGVADIDPLSHLPVLRWLDLGGCTGLTDLSSLGRLPHLQALVLHGCTGLQDLKAIGAIRSLRYLVISDCPDLKDLRPLRVLPSGGTVWVQGSGVRWAPPDLRWTVKGLER